MGIEEYKGSNEIILWTSGKNIPCSVMEDVFSGLLIIAIFWAYIDCKFLLSSNNQILAFFIVHMTPVWVYLGKVFTSGIRARKTEYMITDKMVYIKSGIFSNKVKTISFSDIREFTIHQGFFDRLFHVGDIEINDYCYQYNYSYKSKNTNNIISNVEDFEKVYRIIKNQKESII